MVYIVECAGVYKIGTTTDMHKRMSALQAGCPHPIHICLKMLGHHPVEAILHEEYRDKRSHGEWFRLDENDLASILRDWDFLIVKE
jgi:predicted GIY-YIG superfamily endonuclease